MLEICGDQLEGVTLDDAEPIAEQWVAEIMVTMNRRRYVGW